jgi:predicted RNase H-like HicB family nuclease
MKDYHINVFYSEEDEACVADIPDLKFCSALGDTPEEAVREVQIAKTAWIDAAQSSGKSIPEPKYSATAYLQRFSVT